MYSSFLCSCNLQNAFYKKKLLKNVYVTICVLGYSIPETSFGSFDAIACLMALVELICTLLNDLLSVDCCCTIASPRLSKRSRSIITLWPSTTTVRVASLHVQLLRLLASLGRTEMSQSVSRALRRLHSRPISID